MAVLFLLSLNIPVFGSQFKRHNCLILYLNYCLLSTISTLIFTPRFSYIMLLWLSKLSYEQNFNNCISITYSCFHFRGLIFALKVRSSYLALITLAHERCHRYFNFLCSKLVYHLSLIVCCVSLSYNQPILIFANGIDTNKLNWKVRIKWNFILLYKRDDRTNKTRVLTTLLYKVIKN